MDSTKPGATAATQTAHERWAEPLALFAWLAGAEADSGVLAYAWRTLLQNHPHDSICGCSIDPVHREMMTRFAAVEDTANSVMDACLSRLIPDDDRAARDDRFLLFYNPSPRARSEVARAELRFYLQDIVVGLNPDVKIDPKLPPVPGFVLRDAWGKEIPCQIVRKEEDYDITYSNYNYPRQTYAERVDCARGRKRDPSPGFCGVDGQSCLF